MSRRQFVLVLLALGAASFVVALLLVHGVSHQTIQGAKSTDPGDPEAPTEPSSVKVECASAAGGPRLNGDGNRVDIGDLENARDVHEDDGYTLDQEGISIDDVSDVCGRKRTERLTHAVELGVLGLVLGGSAVLLVRDGRGRSEDEEPEARPSREERGRGVL